LFGFFEAVASNAENSLACPCSQNRKYIINRFYRCFQISDDLLIIDESPLSLTKLFRWFDVGVAACCCRSYRLVINSPSTVFSDAIYFLAAVYVVHVLSEDEVISLAVNDLHKRKGLAFQLFLLMQDDTHLEFFTNSYSIIRKITKKDIIAKFQILQKYRYVIFPMPKELARSFPTRAKL